ncbi:MAG: ABC-F family ATP-binding cassette domain-containing protein [Oscillochloris sp.]|nr:ABC-F family ATP-binding cassette domain-containing protein [Oscillochloris sp.]
MLQISSLRKDIGAATILSAINFTINDGEHVALIGPNGVGKSTLLRIIVGQERPDAGLVALAPGATIGYLAQAFESDLAATLGAAVVAAQADVSQAEAALLRTSEALVAPADLAAALAAYAAALAAFEALGGYARAQRAAAVLQGLGLGDLPPELPVTSLSGGQKTRLGLACLLLREPDLILLDEPTNHLDTEALEWLEGFVQSYPRAALIVSHDRMFLDRTATRTLFLDGQSHTLTSYAGGYSDVLTARARDLAAQAAAYKDQQAYIGKVCADIARLKGHAAGLEGVSTPVGDHDMKWATGWSSGLSSTIARAARSRERKLERYLEADERVEKPRAAWGMKLDFGEPPPGGRAVLDIEDLRFAYPGGRDLFGGLRMELRHAERVALVGPNGAGKSTLLKLVVGQLSPQGGQLRLGSSIKPGLLAQEHELLDPQQSVLAHVLRARPQSEGEARSFLHLFLFGGDSVFRPAGRCSQGERSRLQLALLVLAGCNLLLLDEPLNHLDIEARAHFEQALAAYRGTVLLVSHDRAFVQAYATRRIALGASLSRRP